MPEKNRYEALISKVFHNHFKKRSSQFEFERDELQAVAKTLGIALPNNLGDVIYSFRYRRPLPADVTATAGRGKEWIIEPAGRSRYRFKLTRLGRIVPRSDLLAVKIPDATPEIIAANAKTDEQALLARVRYNRLIDIFLGITTYSLQNHMRTTVSGMGQIEIDEIYVGVNRNGQQFVIPVQAKGGTDQLAAIQTLQDIACCAEKFPNLTCRPISAQFATDETIVLFELAKDDDVIKVVEEKHYKLVPADSIQASDLKQYAKR
ncbi:MAG: hypothetical protein ABSG52_08335 [Terriglobales bacterium]|jgi:hypothetical protein